MGSREEGEEGGKGAEVGNFFGVLEGRWYTDTLEDDSASEGENVAVVMHGRSG